MALSLTSPHIYFGPPVGSRFHPKSQLPPKPALFSLHSPTLPSSAFFRSHKSCTSPGMALSIARPKHRSLTNPSLFHLFSTHSSSNDQNDPNNNDTPQSESPAQSQSSFSSYFSDVKASLRHRHQQMENQTLNQYSRRPLPQQQTSPLNRPSKIASLEEIKKNLSEFRLRSSVPPPTDPNPPSHSSREQPISFQELYKRNVIAKSEDAADRGMLSSPPKPPGNFSFEAIRDSLRQMRSNREANIERRGGDPIPLDTFKNNLRLKPNPAGSSGSTVIGGTGGLPDTIFGKEMKESKEEKGTEATGMEFVKMYKHDELGEKLRSLRPMDGLKDFSLHELSERLVKLREIEEKEAASRVTGFAFKDLRASLNMLKMSDEEKTRRNSIQRLDILGQVDRNTNFMQQPPKEHLVEKYFHPDNMSSSEKMKIELAKIRDEFKMSESDCGSSRVQVAQLTVKIKHLSSILHKKDKHSRKGLIAMVQKRKSILKYLRRTDWDSYCLVLDKLGLRDNTGYKNLARPQ